MSKSINGKPQKSVDFAAIFGNHSHPIKVKEAKVIPIARHTKTKDFLTFWDKYSGKQREQVLIRFNQYYDHFVKQNFNWSLTTEMGEIAPLFFTRLITMFQLR